MEVICAWKISTCAQPLTSKSITYEKLGTQILFKMFFKGRWNENACLVRYNEKWESALQEYKNIVGLTKHFSLHICFNTPIQSSKDKMENSQQVSKQNKLCQKCDFCILAK